MRQNRIRQALQGRQNLVCVQPHFPSPDLVEFLGHLGFASIFVDAEHGGVDIDGAKELVRAADATGMSTMLRVPRNAPEIIQSYLDIGSGGVIVPHITSAEQAEAAVRASKFGPRGGRGAHPSTRAANYGLTQDARTYYARANAETVVAALIEDVCAVERIDEIAATADLDLCIIGREDLAMSAGFPGEPDHPEVARLTECVLKAALRAGLPAGIATVNGPAVPALFDRGFQFVVVNASRMLAAAAREVLAFARSTPCEVTR